ncbi:MAG: ADP-ribosylglycohydrolase family protein [Myxococcales bacterium]
MGSFRPDPNILKKHPNAITQQQIDEKARFIGALLGAAAGEALGAPHENRKAAEVGSPREITGGGIWAAGEPTDDIDLTLVLLRSIVSRKKFDLDDVAHGLVKWFAGKPKDVGKLTRAALENLRAGEPATQSGAIAWEDSERKAAGNGSVMCCAPIGLLHVKNLDGLADDAVAASRITHYDPRCVGACVGVATAVALLVRGGADAEEAVQRSATAAGAHSDDALAAIERGALHKPSDLNVDGDDRGFVLRTLEIAFAALASATSLEEGLVAVVSRGGDTDTNACVAGALLGAKFGKSQVPDRWVGKLKAAPELTSLAEQLYKQL